jgi:hypothetical protein
VVLWPSPLETAMLDGVPGVFVSEKVAGVLIPTTDAVTLYVPRTPPAVTGMLTCPATLVTPEDEPSMHVAPLLGALNVTVTPAYGTLDASLTVTRRSDAKDVPAPAL